MKKFFIASVTAMLLVALTSYSAVVSTNITTGGIHLISTNRANIRNITISSDQNVTVSLYDSDNLAAPYFGTNYVTGAYPTRVSYATNFVTTFVGQNGFTNWYTNAGLWTVTITNAAATNALSSEDFVVSANTAVSYDTSLLLVNGIVARTTTNASIIINYDAGR